MKQRNTRKPQKPFTSLTLLRAVILPLSLGLIMVQPQLTIAAESQQPLQQPPLSPSDRTFTHTLENGLKVIVREDHRAPVMVSQIWYRVGSSYEPVGITGVSHVLEHMMFKGTHNVPTDEFSKLISSYGGSENAFTSYDFTGYYQMMNANNLPLSLELEADRMVNAIFPESEFLKEIEVVKEERRLRTDDNPNSRTYERFLAAAYISSGYHTPIIGWMHDLNTLTYKDALDWYHTWYAPNNATLIVVGDVEHNNVFTLAERYFGSIEAKLLPKVTPPKEIAGLGERRIEVEVTARVPAIYIGYNVPGINTAKEEWEIYALRMLAGVLDGGYSARIETELVRNQQITASAGASYGGFSRGDTLFYFSAVPNQNHTVEEVESALMGQIERLKIELAKPDELARVQAQVISGIIYQQDSISSQANQIGRMESIGRSWQEMEKFAENLKAITPEQIRLVAKKYLVKNRKTVAVLTPKM
ncbi:MAG: insulinase family protein [Pseudomonadales bacterium]|nr:insulinase family protein [Pseudomonadales bacterium]